MDTDLILLYVAVFVKMAAMFGQPSVYYELRDQELLYIALEPYNMIKSQSQCQYVQFGGQEIQWNEG